MTIMRGASMLGAGVVATLWFVSLAVRVTVGATDRSAQVSIGSVPAAPPPLRPLNIPARDPFAADASFTRPSGGNSKSGPVAGGQQPPSTSVGGQFASTNVPDVAALGGAAANVGIMATIVSDSDAYALVEDGGAVRVARAGDALAGSIIAKITDKMVVLANGMQISLDASRGSAVSPSPATANAAVPTMPPSLGPGAAASDRHDAPVQRAEPGESGAHHGASAPPPAMRSTTGVSGYGRTLLTNPNGTPAQQAPPTSGTLFPTVLPSPPVVSPGSSPNQVLQPGGHP
jgi:hypothetical protein